MGRGCWGVWGFIGERLEALFEGFRRATLKPHRFRVGVPLAFLGEGSRLFRFDLRNWPIASPPFFFGGGGGALILRELSNILVEGLLLGLTQP